MGLVSVGSYASCHIAGMALVATVPILMQL